MPVVTLNLAVSIVPGGTFSKDFHSREDLAGCKEQLVENLGLGRLVIIVHCSIVEQSRLVVLDPIESLSYNISHRGDVGIDLTVGTLSDFQENDGALADDLVDNEG